MQLWPVFQPAVSDGSAMLEKFWDPISSARATIGAIVRSDKIG